VATLRQHIQYETVMIHSPIQTVLFAADLDDGFVQMPLVTVLADRPMAGLFSKPPPQKNFSAHARTVWCELIIPRSASRSSTIRRFGGNRKYSRTA